MKKFFAFLFRILFGANIVCIAILTFLLVQLRFPGMMENDIFTHFTRLALTMKILSFWGATNILIVLIYAFKYKPQELYKELSIMWTIVFSVTYFLIGWLLFKESFLNLFI